MYKSFFSCEFLSHGFGLGLLGCRVGVQQRCTAYAANCAARQYLFGFDETMPLATNHKFSSSQSQRLIYRVSQKKRSLRIFTPLGATDASGDNSVGQGCWGDVGWWLGGGGCTRWRTGRCTRWRTRSTRKTRRFTRWRSRSLRKSARTWSGVEFRVKSDRVISSSILCTSLPFLHLVYLLVYHHLSIQHLPDNLYECFCLYSLQLRLLFSSLVRSFSYLATSLVMLSFTFWI